MKSNANRGLNFSFLLYLFLGLSSAKGQQLDFEKYYFGNLDLENYDVIKTSDNGFLMTGNTFGFLNDYFLMKMNEFGDTLWVKFAPAGGLSSGKTIKELSNGNYAVLCTEFNARLWLVIYDSTGNILSSNRFTGNGDLYITNISESNGNLFLLGQDRSSLGTYLIKTDLAGDSMNCHIDTTFLISNHNNSVCFDGRNFVVAGTSIDSSVTYPSIEKFDTSGNVVWKVDYPQYSGSTGSELIRYSDGYVFKVVTLSPGANILRIDSGGSIIWDTPISYLSSSVLSPGNSRILVIEDVVDLYWYDSTGTFMQRQTFPLTLPNVSDEYVVNSFVDNQQIFVSGTVQTWQTRIHSSGFLVQLTDTSLVSSNDLQRNYNNYVYPTMCTSGEQIYFHVVDKFSKQSKYTIYSSLGKVISEGVISISDSYSEPTIKIPASITDGLYFLKIFLNSSNYTFRLIVQ